MSVTVGLRKHNYGVNEKCLMVVKLSLICYQTSSPAV